jgi:hypothetical protein
MSNCKPGRHPWARRLAATWLLIGAALLPPLATAGVEAMARRAEAAPAGQRDTSVLPASARPMGYSLQDMARLTANFNVSARDGSVPLPNTPFRILYASAANPTGSFSAMQGQFLYVPVVYNDNGPPVIGAYPSNAEDHAALLSYWTSQGQFGAVLTEISVDGKPASLGSDYLAGVSFGTPLVDGATQYAVAAAFIHPLSPGVHAVSLRFRATGAALSLPPVDVFFPEGVFEFEVSYTVTVQ